jgi:hypothetical protein
MFYCSPTEAERHEIMDLAKQDMEKQGLKKHPHANTWHNPAEMFRYGMTFHKGGTLVISDLARFKKACDEDKLRKQDNIQRKMNEESANDQLVKDAEEIFGAKAEPQLL